jgi:hypothetical protein
MAFIRESPVTSRVLLGTLLGPLPFLMYINDIWRNIEPAIRLFTDDCIKCRKIINNKLQIDLNSLGE